MAQNVDTLRDHIDSERTGDKVDFSDPSTAPLGTDDEAAGSPPSAKRIQMAHQQELSRASSGPKNNHGMPLTWMVVAGVAIVTALAVFAAAFLRMQA